ncbi:hypothetical protein FK268_10045 [Tsukamurella sputi]|uniref:Uncharacterized protein n=1 Tax=Tsukamurella sputi TaxID=2591848 RepID=A0A5C5RMS1_9ACTN|nr:hypothetical protein [Tsukamurella sputi]TWS23980.1 hypothetical protein FK268_10045 [Tsukamurella sputi]
MNKSTRFGAALALSVLAAATVGTTASAETITYGRGPNFEFRDPGLGTTVYFTPGHPAHNVRLWADNEAGGLTFSVRMFSGDEMVWSAADQSDRVYFVGSNVTRIQMSRDCMCAGRNGVQARG